MSSSRRPSVALKTLDGAYAIARLDRSAPIPSWAEGDGFVSVSRSGDELSVVCRSERVPAEIQHDAGWVSFKFQGPFAFDETGIALAVIQPLSDAGIGIFLVSTFDTDYLLLKQENVNQAVALLTQAGHTVR